MLRLSLLRHAKSGWDDPNLSDHERPLNARGVKAATRMGRYIAEHDLVPELIVCSDATRTHETLSLLLSELSLPKPRTAITQTLYLASPDTILKTIVASAGGAKHVMVIAHNPGIHSLALSLPATSAAAVKGSDWDSLSLKYPTAALAHISFDVATWQDVLPAKGTLEAYAMPRALPQ